MDKHADIKQEKLDLQKSPIIGPFLVHYGWLRLLNSSAQACPYYLNIPLLIDIPVRNTNTKQQHFHRDQGKGNNCAITDNV